MKSIDLLVYGTSRCDTGCSCCNFDSGPEGSDLTPNDVSKLVRSIKIYGRPISNVCFTGGGEPLLWPHLPEAVKAVENCRNVYNIGLVTSGFLKKEINRLENLEKTMAAYPDLHVTPSFHLFHPSFSSRLYNMGLFLFGNSRRRGFNVKVTLPFHLNQAAGLREAMKFIAVADEVFKKLFGRFIVLLLYPWSKKGLSFTSGFLRFWRPCDTFAKRLFFRSFFGDRLYIPAGGDYAGRGALLLIQNAHLWGRMKKQRLDAGRYFEHCSAGKNSLILNPAGNFLLCGHLKNYPEAIVGRVGQNLKTVLENRERLWRRLNISALEISDLDYIGICDACHRRAAEIFG